jgi:hypothetical protein
MNLTTAVKIFLRSDGVGTKSESTHRGNKLRRNLRVGTEGLRWGGLGRRIQLRLQPHSTK